MTRTANQVARTIVCGCVLIGIASSSWVLADEGTEASPAAASSAPSDPVAGRDHWAFRPLEPRPVPAVGDRAWPWGPIDHFVLASLEASGLRPVADADRRTLVRRLYLQLLGLPPTPSQIAEFLADSRPDAVARLVDTLLDSPHFGERWGRHWLDLARYADSNGLDENFLFREAWRYRNWVIESIRDDIPFDRFLLEQIAGDLLPHDSVEQRDRQRIAAGFLVVGPKVLLGNNPKNQRMEVADEQIDTIGRAFLGQTLGCARCHDHKFDPVPTADYYALAGILTSTRVMERRYMLGQQRVMERLVGLGPDGAAADSAYETYWRERPKLTERHQRAKSVLASLEKGDLEAAKAVAEKHSGSVDPGALGEALTKAQRVTAQKALVDRLGTAIAKPPAIPPRAMIPDDVESPADEPIRLAGRFDRLGESVPRGFLRVLGGEPPEIPAGQSGRVELGRWLTDVPNGAGRLVARVFANRVWHHLIGVGLVRTVDNFGRTGEAPSHPELLDHLARQLIDSGWSLKMLVRTIVLSRTFAVGSDHGAAGHEVDPDNRLLWRAHRRRLDPESLRDAMLAVAGELDLKPMDSTVWYLGDQATAVGANKNRRRTDFPCRSVYLPIIRNDLPEIFDAFDFADPHATTGMRPRTASATQGLFVLNDESVRRAAESLARRILSRSADSERVSATSVSPDARLAENEAVAGRVGVLFELVFGRVATPGERLEFLEFVHSLEEEISADGDDDARFRAWSMACHALLASSRFQILE